MSALVSSVLTAIDRRVLRGGVEGAEVGNAFALPLLSRSLLITVVLKCRAERRSVYVVVLDVLSTTGAGAGANSFLLVDGGEEDIGGKNDTGRYARMPLKR